jgi:LacI family transcriptional regulator
MGRESDLSLKRTPTFVRLSELLELSKLQDSSKNPPASRAKPAARADTSLRKPTMSDVARLAGVGTMTVSRVLSGTVPVTAETAKRVQNAIDQLHYRPNELARAFRGQKSRTIGLIIPYLYDPFFANCAHAVTTVAKEHGYSVIITTSNEDPDTEFAEAEQMLQRHVDGLVAIPAPNRESRIARALFGKTPVVVFDRPVSDPAIDVVLVQNTAGARRVTEHLIEHGHKRIAFMGLSRNLFTINTRFLGYRRALADAGLEEDAFFGCATPASTLEAMRIKFQGPNAPTAIFTSNTLATRYVLSALVHLGLKMPNDVAFVGFDDFDMAEFTSPSLTVVRQPALEMGRVAASLLFDRIARGESPQTGNKIVLPVEIVLRRSCGCKHRTPIVIH